jgi:hypothetical protein
MNLPGGEKGYLYPEGRRLNVPGRRTLNALYLEWEKLNVSVSEKSSLYIEERNAECNWKGERLFVPEREGLNVPKRSSLIVSGREKEQCNWKGERLTIPGREKDSM